MHGVFIKSGLKDWQILQQEQGFGSISLSGTFQVPQAAQEVGTELALPVVRVLSEEDNSQILPWTNANHYPSQDGMSGSWDISLTLPAGGLYRIETGLDTKSTQPELSWIFRGDVRFHIGVGDLFVIAGQSNSSGYGRDSAFDPPDINVHLYRNRSLWDLACHPINESSDAADQVNAEMGISGTSPYLSFAKAFHKISHCPVGLIACSLGGSPISRWDCSQNGDLFSHMIERIKECGIKASGILWYQGCSDTNAESASTYYEAFERLVTETRRCLGYEIPFFTYQLNRQVNAEYNEEWGILREAQRQAALRLPGVFILPTLHSSLCDGIHNNSHSSLMLGENMARLCGSVLYQSIEFLAADITKVEILHQTLLVSFSNMKKGFLIINGNPQQCGFLIKDSKGIVPIQSYCAIKASPCLEFTLERVPEAGAVISYGWEADPSHIVLYDEVTFMPPLCFYEYPITLTLE